MESLFRFFLLVSFVVFGPIAVEGADLPVDVTGATTQLSMGGNSSSFLWGGGAAFTSDGTTLGIEAVDITSFPIGANFAIVETFQLGSSYGGGDKPPLLWRVGLNQMDFGALGVHSMAVDGEFTFDQESLEVEWVMDSAPPLVFGPGNEYTLTILGIALPGDLSSPVAQIVVPQSVTDYSLVAYLSGPEMVVPEPETYLLLGSLLALGGLVRRRMSVKS